ncbi:MAG TPA: hypothetical protein VH597_08530 [Verrucomicrobiae bacterium]|nr:hypothetical protein [Verrucomicrobiae bacterium]
MVWHDGHVQHVWGLGIGLWLLPFEAIWRLFDNQPFPDRIALGFAFALLAFYSAATGLKLIRQGQRTIGLAIIWMVELCPALWTLARADQLVFEETILYSVILSLAILISLIRAAIFNSRTDYFLCCALSSFAIWVRPTHAVYGVGAILIASLVAWQRRHKITELILGSSLWLVSIVLLAWTNAARFGSPTEFGHHLTVTTGNMIYFTRFGNPSRDASLFQAAKELFGLLFLVNPQGAFAFSENLFIGQSPVIRWRRLDLSAFDLSYVILIVIAIAMTLLWLKQHRRQIAFWQQPQSVLISALLIWSGFSTLALGWFYLYYPAVASRYLFDFAPAFTGFGLLVWLLLPNRWLKFAGPLLVAWLVYEIISAKVPLTAQQDRSPIRLALPRAQGTALRDFNGTYTTDNSPAKTGIVGNGYGWDADGGIAFNVLSLAVDRPEFIELHLSPRRSSNGVSARNDSYRAQIDGQTLPLRDVAAENDGLKITFVIPQNIRQRQRDEMLFLCFSDRYDAADRNSERFLYSVRWR